MTSSADLDSQQSEKVIGMGADWMCLFDKRLCDEILSLAPATIHIFVQAHLLQLHDLSLFKCGFEEGVPTAVRFTRLREQGRTDDELKADLVEHLCVSRERLTIDYWGCYAEVFTSGDPPGSIPDYKLFPHIEQQGYLLLRPEHVDRMLASLKEHRRDLRIMTEQQISQLRHWTAHCKKDPGYMMAYFYDV